MVGRVGGAVPAQMLWTVFVALLMALLLNRHRFGAHVYLIGDNIESARLMGINVRQRKTALFVLMAVAAAFAGLIASLEVTYYWPTLGDGYLLTTIASVFLGGIGDEERHTGGDVVRSAHPAPRHERVAQLRRVPRHVEVPGDLDEAGPHRVHADAPGRQLDGELPGKRIDGALRRRVRGVPGEPRETMDRGDVDDRAAALGHPLNGALGTEEVPAHIDIEDLVVDGLAGLHEGVGARHPAVVDQEVEPAERAGGGVDDPGTVAHLPEVTLHHHRPGPGPRDGIDRLAGALLRVGVVHRHLRPLAGQLERDPLADAHARTGDKRPASIERTH